MKKAVKHTLALAAVAIAAQASAQVTFYEREGFQGESFTTRRQIGDLNRFGFNDSASSAVVAGESWERWQVCEDVRFNGRCVVLAPGQYPNLRAMGLNNRITSVQAVARVDAPPPIAAAPLSARGRVAFYESEGFGGRSMVSQDDLSDLNRTGFNDRISSIEVFGGPWEICQASAYGGPCAVLRPGQYPSLRAIGFDNSISSIRAIGRDSGPGSSAAQVMFYEGEGFGGRSFTTQGDVLDFGRFGFNNRAASVEVMSGWFEVCQGASYSGQCVFLRPGKYPSLASMGLNNRIASARVAGADERAQDTRGAPVALFDARRRNGEQLFEATVVAVRAVVGPPEQRCWIDRDQVSTDPSRANVPATIAGAVIGGILGHQVGNGRGRDLATVGGLIVGGALGNSLGRDGRAQTQTQDVQRCSTVPSQARPDLYDVTYNFRGLEHRVQMTTPPGSTILVNQEGEPRV